MSSGIVPPDDEDSLAIACALVGRFQFHFSRIESELNTAIAKIFELNEGAANILTANIDFFKKTSIIKSMIKLQFSEGGDSFERIFKDISQINDDRQIIIHSTFEASGKDSVQFRRVTARDQLKINTPTWGRKEFEARFEKMGKMVTKLQQIVADLKPYRPSLDFSDPQNSMYLAVL